MHKLLKLSSPLTYYISKAIKCSLNSLWHTKSPSIEIESHSYTNVVLRCAKHSNVKLRLITPATIKCVPMSHLNRGPTTESRSTRRAPFHKRTSKSLEISKARQFIKEFMKLLNKRLENRLDLLFWPINVVK
ncbi:MAG: hypothetical protein DDT30_01625 [Dehalococcoidia bacterium]|nr:hypothetical protein [Bacillota bacterium]